MNYIYIDDDAIDKSKDKVSGFISKELTIETQQHKGSWEEQIKYISDISDNIDGLILDLELNDLPNEKNERAYFRGTSLAQEIRTGQKGNDIRSFPIVLFSAQEKLDTLLESTGIDLFDICINKDVSSDVFEQYTLQLYSLACGYKRLIDEEEVSGILGIKTDLIDFRFISELHRNMKLPIHVRAMFILRELINKQGLLIDEEVLAARMGIDKNSSEDWNILLEIINSTKYTGVFSEGWQRWWMPLIEEWFESITTDNWRSLSARERVEIITKKTGLSRLTFAEKIKQEVLVKKLNENIVAPDVEKEIEIGEEKEFGYTPTNIFCNDIDRVEKRNAHKQSIMNYLLTIHEIKGIPYEMYFMSCNLDHALYDKMNLDENLKQE